MSDTLEGLRHQIHSAIQLQSVVRTTKTLAASSIGQYERSVRALVDYCETVELGLAACFHQDPAVRPRQLEATIAASPRIAAVIFGSDQGLVGRFNETVVDHAIQELNQLPKPAQIWTVGERVTTRLVDSGIKPALQFRVPNSVQGITSLVGEILLAVVPEGNDDAELELYLYYNRPAPGLLCAPATQRLLPLDDDWRRRLRAHPWPTHLLPQTIASRRDTLRGLIHEYLFVLLFRAAAESIVSEHASRLSAMQRAEKNIQELLEVLTLTFHRLRQSTIDEELFDLVSGFEALSGSK